MSDKKRAVNERPKVVSLRDYNNEDEETDSDDEKQSYYTGGEKSGTAVFGLSPADEEKNNSLLQAIFAQASPEQPPTSNQSQSVFLGEAKTVSGITFKDDSKPKKKMATLNLIFWKDGFTLEDGPLRTFDRPENLQLLKKIQLGTLTASDLGIDPHELVDLRLSQLPDQMFNEKKRATIIQSGSNEDPAMPQLMVGEAKTVSENGEIPQITVDRSLVRNQDVTTTRLQIQLPNGTKKVITIDPHQKIMGLYEAVRVATGIHKFKLRTLGPVADIPEDLDATIAEANLMNSALKLLD